MFISQISKAKLARAALVMALIICSGLAFAQLQTAVQVSTNSNNQAEQSQGQVNRLTDQTEELLVQYRTVISEVESLTIYNQELESLVNNQRNSIQTHIEEMEGLESTNRAIVPLVLEMVDMLRKIVDADVPFLKQERIERVRKLEDNLDASNVTTSEKYRKVTEAYQIELDYGRTVGTYQGNLDSGTKVNFLRIGRTALLYQSLDENTSGWWNPQTKAFETLDKSYNSSIKDAIRIAAKQAAPNLVGLPLLKQVSGE